MKVKNIAILWWNKLSFEDKFFRTIAANEVIEGDRTRNPNSLTDEEIVKIYKYHSN